MCWTWFGFAEVYIEVPGELWSKFEELPPLYLNGVIPCEAVLQHMKDYLVKSKRSPVQKEKKCLGELSAKKILLYAPLLRWYLDHGLQITALYRTIDYKPQKKFPWFVNQVTENKRKGDLDPEKALLAEVFKLLGNSLRRAARSCGEANKSDLHEGRRKSRQSAALGVVRRPGRDWRRLRTRMQKKQCHYQPSLSNRHRGVSVCKGASAGVLLQRIGLLC